MVIVALDVGERRIGVAVADPGGRLATPVGAVVRRDGPGTREAIATVMRERGGTCLVVGVPLGPNGEETPRAGAIRVFARGLADHLGVPVEFRDERYTTQDALARSRAKSEVPEGRRRGARRPPSPHAREVARRWIDAMAAAILLQAHLDEAMNEGQGSRQPPPGAMGEVSPGTAGDSPGPGKGQAPTTRMTTAVPSDVSELFADALRDADDDAVTAGDDAAPSRAPGTRG